MQTKQSYFFYNALGFLLTPAGCWMSCSFFHCCGNIEYNSVEELCALVLFQIATIILLILQGGPDGSPWTCLDKHEYEKLEEEEIVPLIFAGVILKWGTAIFGVATLSFLSLFGTCGDRFI